jgi:DNA recombination protein RmuC
MDLKGENGNTLKPDVIVKLPENKHILVDSKLTLVDYEQFWNAEDEVSRRGYLKSFVSAVYLHIDQLAAKHYPRAKNLEAPDFILLFMPIEGAFALAMQADPSLWPSAWEKNVMIVGPSTLLPCLKTVAAIWRHEMQNKNVQEIARQAGDLYDKFVGLLEDIDRTYKQMESAQESLETMRDKIRGGKGSLTARVEKLKELGAKTDKQLSKDYLLEEPSK